MTDSATSTARAPATPGPGAILISLADADLKVQLRNGPALAISLLLPLVLMYVLGLGKRGAIFPPGSRMAIAIALGITSMAVLGYTMTLARDRENGVFQRLRVTPASTWAIMGSRLAIQAAAIVLMTLVVFVAGAVLLNFSLSPAAYGVTILAAVLGAAEFLSVGQAIVALMKSADMVSAVGRLLYFPLFALGMFSNVSVFGSTLETIARWSPGGVLINMLAGAMSPSTWSPETWWSVFASLGYTVVFVGVGIRWFHWEAR